MKKACLIKFIFISLLISSRFSHGQVLNGEQNSSENLAPYSFAPSLSFDPMTNMSVTIARDGIFIRDGDFELFGLSEADDCDISTNCSSTAARASLQENCISTKWQVSHGTPEICVDGNGNHSIHLWAGDWGNDGDLEGEGIFYNCPLSWSKYYEISMKLSSSDPIDHIYFYLVNNPVHKELDGTQYTIVEDNPFYEIPSFGECIQLLDVIDNFNSASPVSYTIPVFSPDPSLAGNGSKLWIYAEDDDAQATLLFIDDVTDGVFGTTQICEGTSSFSGNIPSGTEFAYNIIAQNSATVISGNTVSFVAGNSITLTPDFHAQNGSTFSAKISECPVTNNYPSVPVVACGDIFLSTRIQSEGSKSEQNELDKNEIVVFPNPTQDILTVRYYVDENGESSSIIIYNSTGIEVLNVITTHEKSNAKFVDHEIDLSNFLSGIYYINYKSKSINKIHKFIKQD